MSVTIWHNPRCSKSRQTLALIEEKGITPTIRLYLEDTPTAAEMKSVLAMLGRSPRDLARTGEDDYKAAGMADLEDDALIAAMIAHPRTIERPVVINGDRAAVGRPPEDVLAIL